MHSTVEQSIIATDLITSDRPTIQTPQRKANYNDKDRPRRKDLKALALKKYGCSCTSTVKKYLKVLEIKLDLRLTAAWKAVVYELHERIIAAKAIVDALEPKPGIKVGSVVNIVDCPWNLYNQAPFVIGAIKEGMAHLDFVVTPFPLKRLELINN